MDIYIRIYAYVQGVLLSFPGGQLLTWDDSMNAGFVCHKAVVLRAPIKETPCTHFKEERGHVVKHYYCLPSLSRIHVNTFIGFRECIWTSCLYSLACFLLAAEKGFHYVFSLIAESHTYGGQSICRCHVFKGSTVLTSPDTVPMICLNILD